MLSKSLTLILSLSGYSSRNFTLSLLTVFVLIFIASSLIIEYSLFNCSEDKNSIKLFI